MRCALLMTVLAVLVPTAGTQTLPSKKDAADMLAKAASSADLNGPDTPAFHLTAKVHYELAGANSDGTYELLWAARDRYREEYRSGSAGETAVVLGDKRYVLRTTEAMALGLWRLRRIVPYPVNFLTPSDRGHDRNRVTTVSSTRKNGSAEFCARADTEYRRREACFDAETLDVVSAEFSLKAKEPLFRNQADDFVSLGPKRYPRHHLFHNRYETLEITVDKLEPVTQFSDDLFVALAGGRVFDWCAEPIRQKAQSQPPEKGTARLFNGSGMNREDMAYYVLVGTDGRVMKAIPLLRTSETGEAATSNWLSTAKLPVETCGGKAIEYEEVFEEMAPVALGSGVASGRTH